MTHSEQNSVGVQESRGHDSQKGAPEGESFWYTVEKVANAMAESGGGFFWKVLRRTAQSTIRDEREKQLPESERRALPPRDWDVSKLPPYADFSNALPPPPVRPETTEKFWKSREGRRMRKRLDEIERLDRIYLAGRLTPEQEAEEERKAEERSEQRVAEWMRQWAERSRLKQEAWERRKKGWFERWLDRQGEDDNSAMNRAFEFVFDKLGLPRDPEATAGDHRSPMEDRAHDAPPADASSEDDGARRLREFVRGHARKT